LDSAADWRDLLRLILQDHRARRLQRVVMLERQLDRKIKRHSRWGILGRGLRWALRVTACRTK